MKRLIMILVLLDNWLTGSAKKIFPTRWKRAGKCNQCGVCCKEIYLKMTPGQMKSPLFTTLAVRWISWLFDFILLRIEREYDYLVFTCKHITPGGKCGNYFWRPNICRNFPLVNYFKEPKFIPGCGFNSKK